jgi:paired amphipathic helix protein Sin3a
MDYPVNEMKPVSRFMPMHQRPRMAPIGHKMHLHDENSRQVSDKHQSHMAVMPNPLLNHPSKIIGKAPPFTPPKQIATDEPDLTDAMMYLNRVKEEFRDDPTTYDSFLEVMRDYKQGKVDASGVVRAVSALFRGRKHLIEGFNNFLPKQYKMEDKEREERRPFMPGPSKGSFYEPREMYDGYDKMKPHPPYRRPPFPPQQMYKQFPVPKPSRVEETEDVCKQKMALNFVQKVKKRLSSRPEAYRGFIEILQQYQKNQGPPDKILHQLKEILGGHPDLIEEFIEFIPSKTREIETKKGFQEMSFNKEQREMFSKIKEILQEKDAYSDFLKCLNLYNQDLVEGKDLIFLIKPLFKNEKLVEAFKGYINYKEIDLPPYSMKNLAKYKKMGSYRILPEKYRDVECKGQDAISAEVLNKFCVSCPTLVSEDSTFLSSKKSIHEEALFRIEDERYESELLVERVNSLIISLERCLGVKEEIEMSDIDMSPGVVQEILSSIYGDKGTDILEGIILKPMVSIPIVLRRLYTLTKVWRREIREKNKIWRETMLKNYYKALDVQGVGYRAQEKKVLSNKTLLKDIPYSTVVEDTDIFSDISELLFLYLGSSDISEKENVEKVFKLLVDLIKKENGPFYVNSSVVCLFKLVFILYEGLKDVKNIKTEVSTNPVAVKLSLQEDVVTTGRYSDTIRLIKEYLGHTIDSSMFEERLRFITECKGYKISAIDKIFNKIERQCFTVANDDISMSILKMTGKGITTRSGAESICKEEPLFECNRSGGMFSITECGKKDDQWKDYIDKFIKMKYDKSLVGRRVFLKRSLRQSIGEAVISYRLQCRICSNTLKVKFVEDSEDFLMRRNVKRVGGST